MQTSIGSKYLKNETIFATLGMIMLATVFIFRSEIVLHSSPLALLIIAAFGFLLSLKFELAGGIFLFFGGLALAVHPLLFSSSLWLIPGGAVTGFAGFLTLIKWWKQNDN